MHPRIAHQFLFSTTEVHSARLIKTFTAQRTRSIVPFWKNWSVFLRRHGFLQMRRT